MLREKSKPYSYAGKADNGCCVTKLGKPDILLAVLG